MFCPQCRAEYRRGFTVCADCEVPLVESLELTAPDATDPESRESIRGAPGDPNTDPFCSFWKGTDLRVCTEICAVLDDAGILHKMIRRQDHLFHWSQQSPYQIGVPASLYEKAELAIKEAFGTDPEGAEDAVYLLPPPEEDPRARHDRANAITGGAHPEAADEKEQADEDGGQETIAAADDARDTSETVGSAKRIRDEDWYPEDATSLAWDGEPADWRDMIEMSLRENDIRMRRLVQDGKPQLFVLPRDEERAKGIVREILQGQPPE